MEAQQGQPGRGLQRLRVIPGSRYARADHADRGRRHHLRHGRSYFTANVAIHTAVRQEDSRSVAGRDSGES